MKTTPLSFRHELEKKEPRTSDGGTTRGASVTDFPASVGIPISSTISGSIIELQPGALRQMHWHPNADEWQYYISGQAEMSVFLAESTVITEQFDAGDVGYVPMAAGHYIKNTGNTSCKILIGFNSGTYHSIDLSKWLAGNPEDVVVTNFGLKDGEIEKFPTEKIFIQPKI